MKAYDAYYTCEDPSCDAEPTVGSTETSQDWFTYVEDDDPYKPFCVPFEPNSTDNVRNSHSNSVYRAILCLLITLARP